VRPLILSMHDEFTDEMRKLRGAELDQVGGAGPCPTVTVTPDGDGGDDGTDCC